jgi:hypothetical protein
MTNRSPDIKRANLIGSSLAVMLVLCGCTRLPDQTLTVSRSRDVGQAGKPRNVIQARKPRDVSQAVKPRDVSQAGKPRDVGQAGKPIDVSPKPVDAAKEISRISDDPVQPLQESAPYSTVGQGNLPHVTDLPHRPLPMKPMFNPDEEIIKETEDDARLRRIMRICIC